MTPSPHAFAVIDGAFCQLTRFGRTIQRHAPLATAVADFHPGPLCFYVREHPFGLLPGLPNLYCLDGGFRLQWMAEWPNPADPCAEIVRVDGATLIATSVAGMTVRLDAHNGRLLSAELPVSIAS